MEGTISTSPRDAWIALVTGANKGIGLEISRQLASNGVKVILTARDELLGKEALQKLKDSGYSDVIFHQLDVTDPSSVSSLAEFLSARFGRLDILVNNAAIVGFQRDMIALEASKPKDGDRESSRDIPGWMRPHLKQTYEMAERCLQTNYCGTKAVTKALIPLLLQSSLPGRIVNVSSTLGQLWVIENEELRRELSDIERLTEERLDDLMRLFLKDFKDGMLGSSGWPVLASAYKVSKVLVNAYTRILARSHPALCVNCVSPGYVKTDLSGNMGVLTVEEGAKGPVLLAMGCHHGATGLFFDQTEVSTF